MENEQNTLDQQIEERARLKQDIRNLILKRNLSFKYVDSILSSLLAEFRDKVNGTRIKDINGEVPKEEMPEEETPQGKVIKVKDPYFDPVTRLTLITDKAIMLLERRIDKALETKDFSEETIYDIRHLAHTALYTVQMIRKFKEA